MQIDRKEVEGQPRKLGTLKGRPVMHVRLKGGLHIIAAAKGMGHETLGMAHHVAVAKHMAQRYEPDVVWTELSKSEHWDIRLYQDMIPAAEELTARARALESQG
jgi:hypothetical protein